MSSRSDKSTSTPSTPTTPIPPNVTKLCHIIKRPDFDGYGFNLHSEKVKPGQFIGKVDPKSPAEEAGLKEGDRIIEVNGVPIGSETHKQVVQRIKAISCEVRLLLIDVDGKGDAPKSPVAAVATTPTKTPQTPPASPAEAAAPSLPTTPPPPSVTQAMANGNGDFSAYEGTKQELPGESSNISSISMVSTKRISSASSASSNHSHSADVVDRASVDSSSKQNGAVPLMAPMPDLTNGIMDKQQQQERQEQHAKEVAALSNNNNNNSNNFNNNMMPPSQAAASTAIIASEKSAAPAANVPPPPSAITAANQNNNNNMGNGNSNGSANGAIMQSTTITNTQTTVTTTSQVNNNGTGVIRAGSLNLPMTAAEMRAKLMSKKKYDPKSEGVDLKKKFEIIQKL